MIAYLCSSISGKLCKNAPIPIAAKFTTHIDMEFFISFQNGFHSSYTYIFLWVYIDYFVVCNYLFRNKLIEYLSHRLIDMIIIVRSVMQ